MNRDKVKCYIYTRVSTALQVDGYALESGELVIAEDETDIIRMIFDRYYYYCKNTVNATGHKCTFHTNIEQSQIDGMLERLISAMTREGKFKEAIQSKIGTTVDTSDMEKELSVLSARLHQAEAIKTRIEQQMDSLDVNTAHYEKKIADLQRRLDSQYDTIDETEHAIEEVKTQIFDLKKSSISADSIYEFLLHFDEIYRECTDAERKKFMHFSRFLITQQQEISCFYALMIRKQLMITVVKVLFRNLLLK